MYYSPPRLLCALLQILLLNMVVCELDKDDSFARLTDEEIYWQDHQEFLEVHGYMLHARYQPGWTPSWRGKPEATILDSEDAFSLPVSHLSVKLYSC